MGCAIAESVIKKACFHTRGRYGQEPLMFVSSAVTMMTAVAFAVSTHASTLLPCVLIAGVCNGVNLQGALREFEM